MAYPKTYKTDKGVYEIPEKEVSSFLKDFPNAMEVVSYKMGKDTFDIPVQETEVFLKENPQAVPLKKKEPSGNGLQEPSDGGLGGTTPKTETFPTIEMYQTPTGDLTEDPFAQVKKSKELLGKTKVVSKGGIGGMGMGTTGTEIVPDEEATKEANKIQEELKRTGYKEDFFAGISDLPEDVYNNPTTSKETLSVLYKNNPVKFTQLTNEAKNKYAIRDAAAKKAYDEAQGDDKQKTEYASRVGILKGNEYSGDEIAPPENMQQFYDIVKQKQQLIDQNIDNPEEKKKAQERLRQTYAQAINPTSLDFREEYQNSGLADKLDVTQYAGLKTYELFEPEKAKVLRSMVEANITPQWNVNVQVTPEEQVRSIVTDSAMAEKMGGVISELTTNQRIAKEEALRELSLIGATNEYDSIVSEQNDLKNKYKEAQTDEEKANIYAKMLLNEQRANDLQKTEAKNDERYPITAKLKMDNLVKEIVQDRGIGVGGWMWNKYTHGVGTPIDAASMLLTSWFGSEKDKTDLRMKLIGQGKQFEASIYLPESERSVNSPVIIQASDELKKKAKEILNGRSLSELSPDEKDKLSQLVASNQDQIKTITNPEAGKSKNFWSKATGMTIAGFTADMGSFLTKMGLMQGVGMGAKAAEATTLFMDGYEPAFNKKLSEGASVESANEYGILHGAVLSLMSKFGSKYETIKNVVKGGNSPISKYIAGLSEESWNKLAAESKPLLSKVGAATKNVVKEQGKMIGTFGVAAPVASALADNLFYDEGRSVKEIADEVPLIAKEMAIGGIGFGLFGLAKGVMKTKATPVEKAALFEMADFPELGKMRIDEAVKNREISKEEGERKKSIIDSVSRLVEQVPEVNDKGKPLNDQQRANYLFNLAVKESQKEKAKTLPEKQAEEAKQKALVADKENQIELEALTEKQLNDRKDKLEKAISKVDEKGKPELSDKEMADAKAELEAVNNIIKSKGDTTKTEEKLPKLSEPIEGVDEFGVPIGENVPPEVKGEPEQITQPIELSVEPSGEVKPLTKEAEDLLASIGEGSKPTFITKNLERIAKENGIEVTDKMSADDVINALKEKQSQPTVTNKEQIPNEPITESVEDWSKDVESTANKLKETEQKNPSLWQKIKDAFNKGINKVFGGSLKMNDSEKLSPEKIKNRIDLIAQKLGVIIEYKPHPKGAAFQIANDGKFYITIDPKLFEKGFNGQEAFNTINVIAHELGHAIDAKEVFKNNLSEQEITELAKLHRAFINTFNFDVGEDVSGLEKSIKNNNKSITGEGEDIDKLRNPKTNAHRHEQEELFADALRMMVISPELAKRIAPNLFERLSKYGLGDNEHQSISEAYHKAKADGSNPELVKAVEDLLGKPKETTPTPQTGKGESIEAKKTDIERRRPTSYIENSKNKKSSLETFRNEAKREWDGVSVITGDRMQNLYVGIQLFVEAYPEYKELLDKFIKNDKGYIGITNNNLSFVLNTLKKEGVTTESELGAKINAKYDVELAELEKQSTPNSKGKGTGTPNVEDWSREQQRIENDKSLSPEQKEKAKIESTAKALKIEDDKGEEALIRSGAFSATPKSFFEKYRGNKNPSVPIADAYHDAKKNNNNPELVKAVEDLLGKPKETKIPNEPITEPVTKPIPEVTEATKEQGVKEAVPEGTTETGRTEPEGAASVLDESRKKGITHAAVEELRKIIGEPEYEGRPTETHEQLIKEAQETISKDKSAALKVIEKMESQGEVSNKDNAIAAVYKATLDAEIERNPTKELLKQAKRLAKALDVSGTKLGKALESRKLIGEENNLANFLMQKEAAQGTELTENQIKEQSAKYNELKEAKEALEKQLEAEREQHKKDIAELGLNKAKAKARREAKKTDAEYKAERKSAVEAAREALKQIRETPQVSGAPLFRELVAIAPHVKEYLNSLASQGVDKLDNIISEIHAEFKDVLNGLTTKNVLDILAGEYDEKKTGLTKNETAATVRLLQREAKLIKELADAKKGLEKAKTEEKVIESNRRIDELKEKIKEVKRLNKEGTEKEPVEDLSAGSNEDVAKYEEKLLRKIDKLNKDLKEGNYLKEPEKEPIFKKTRKAQILEDRVIDLENKIRHERSKDEYNKRSKLRKGFDKVMEVLGVRRLVQSALDISVPFRQGATMLSPRKIDVWSKGFKANLQSIFNPKKFERIMHEIRNDPMYHEMTKDNVVFNDMGSADPNLHNEDFRKSFIYKIPILSEPLKASNRSADAFLNVARYEMYKKLRANLEKKGFTREADPKAFKYIGNWVMSMTGRGKMHSALEKPAMNAVLGNTFYGARLMASRLNLLNPVTYFDPRIPKEVRYEAMKDMAAFTSTMMTVATALAYTTGAKISLNPDDSDFLQLRYGNKVYDISGGLANYVRTGLRIIKAAYTKATGTKYEGRESTKKAGESVVNFFRNKLSPNTSYAVDAFFGGRYGQDFDPSDIYRIYPMYTEDFIKAWKEEGGLLATSTVLVPNIVGIGYGSYASKVQIDATLEDLQKRNMRSDEMDKEKIHNYNDGGRPITIKEFEEFAKKRDEEIGKDLKLLFENGINGVPYKDLTPEQVQDETSYIKATATRQVKEEMFGKQKMTRQEKKERKKLSKQRIEKYKNN